MAQAFSDNFYSGPEWRATKEAYLSKVGRLCERCLKQGKVVPAEIVHHKIHLTPDNLTNPDIALSFSNLEAVCRRHHAEAHKKHVKRWYINEEGKVVPRE